MRMQTLLLQAALCLALLRTCWACCHVCLHCCHCGKWRCLLEEALLLQPHCA